jgi:hypothetical protein
VWSRVWLTPFALFPQVADTVVGIAASLLVASHASRLREPAEDLRTTTPAPTRQSRLRRLRPAIGGLRRPLASRATQ